MVALATVVNLMAVKKRAASMPSVSPPQNEYRKASRVRGIFLTARYAAITIPNSKNR